MTTLIFDETIAARASWSRVINAGETLRITDLHGNQAVDFLVFDAHDYSHRYSAADTISKQRNILLVVGTQLLSNEGVPMMTITHSTCAYHDTVGGSCSREINSVRYGQHTAHQHACVDNFLDLCLRHGLSKRDIVPNVNFFMNVPVDPDGTLGIVDGISGPGLLVDVRAEIDVLVMISNCPQINNPCNGFDPTPVQAQVWSGTPVTPVTD
jgi:uncharacterized protein